MAIDPAEAVSRHVERGRPLIICDVDEVVLHFVSPFETFLKDHGAQLNKTSFKIGGNIIDVDSGNAYSNHDASEFVARFHRSYIDRQPPVDEAVDYLDRLSGDFQIVFLTNVPEELGIRRAAHLQSLGLNFPVLANSGSKAETVAALSSKADAPAVFIDDLPPHHFMVKTAVPSIHCIHFMADETFRRLAEIDDNLVTRTESWQDISAACLKIL
ncbi:MAG: hypothetical protein AAGE89_13045 [Pseudomonadota bacterium]